MEHVRQNGAMTNIDLDSFVNAASVADDVFELRPDYRVLLLAVDGIEPAGSDNDSAAMLQAAQDEAARSWCAQPAMRTSM